jgi:hypothetical protein
MGWLRWAGIMPAFLVAMGIVLRRPLRQYTEEIHVDKARKLFRLQRERLEARFVGTVAKTDAIEGERWDGAHWHDGVVWARDRQTRRLFALVEVRLPTGEFAIEPECAPPHATALFEFRKGRWCAEGIRLDEVRPDEAIRPNQRFEPVLMAHRRV